MNLHIFLKKKNKMTIKNPIFIPKSFREEKEEGEKILYRILAIQGKEIRVIEYYKKDLLYRVNVWGICEELRELEDCFVAHDKDIDFETARGLREPVEAMYPKPVTITFF